MTEMSVEPYREIVFDKDGDGPAGQAARVAELARRGGGCTDLVLFAHGWNNSPSVATRFYSSFFAPFPGVTGPGVRLGYAGVVWPSMMFSDEPVPDYASLAATVPGKTAVVARLAELIGAEPEEEAAFVEFGSLLRELTDTDRADVLAGGAEVPDFLVGDPLEVYARFAAAGEEPGEGSGEGEGGGEGSGEGGSGEPGAGSGQGEGEGPGEALFGGGDRVKRLWKGAKEALRQATYYTMKRRAGVVGARGLGPLLGELARTAPALRVHLAGHSFGARLVAHALLGLPAGARNVKSVTLLQGAFSHYAFAPRLPHDQAHGGPLKDLLPRVDGPLVACHSHHDTALRVFYPLASRLSRDDDSLLGQDDRRWGAIGYDGFQSVPDTATRTLESALRDGLPAAGCVSVDTARVVSEHSDICHTELARVVARAGRFGR
ncbi:serine-threonine protein kinase [Streptomyces sp. NPDC085481]|uniref:serine-threonine protein kinase n=1 Tax=Streptomyces sp. NPDC085481 TaxID=3365727 RepID=UPI0037CCE61A